MVLRIVVLCDAISCTTGPLLCYIMQRNVVGLFFKMYIEGTTIKTAQRGIQGSGTYQSLGQALRKSWGFLSMISYLAVGYVCGSNEGWVFEDLLSGSGHFPGLSCGQQPTR